MLKLFKNLANNDNGFLKKVLKNQVKDQDQSEIDFSLTMEKDIKKIGKGKFNLKIIKLTQKLIEIK